MKQEQHSENNWVVYQLMFLIDIVYVIFTAETKISDTFKRLSYSLTVANTLPLSCAPRGERFYYFVLIGMHYRKTIPE